MCCEPQSANLYLNPFQIPRRALFYSNMPSWTSPLINFIDSPAIRIIIWIPTAACGRCWSYGVEQKLCQQGHHKSKRDYPRTNRIHFCVSFRTPSPYSPPCASHWAKLCPPSPIIPAASSLCRLMPRPAPTALPRWRWHRPGVGSPFAGRRPLTPWRRT